MKPAASIIIFSVLSGFGFGLFFWFDLGLHSVELFPSELILALGFIFSIAGLISSSFHLGNPQRALLAFTQWKSSWLSREAILAVLTLLINFLHLILIGAFNTNQKSIGLLGALLSLLTIYSTAMIYTQMKTVPRWNMRLTPVLFILYGLTGSSVILANFGFSAMMFVILGIFQVNIWRTGDTKYRSQSHIGSATGLSTQRTLVRMLEPPHTGSNYLLKEMVHIVAQKHIHKLRWISLICLSIVPCLISLSHFLYYINTNILAISIAVISILGTLLSRWLFFAEAEHVVGFYYDR